MSPHATSQIRRRLRPGDLGAIIAHHGRVYGEEYGVDAEFEAHVAASVARAATRGFPGPREAICLVERDGVLAGSVGLTEESDDTATLRWFVLDRQLRGHGLGSRMLKEMLTSAERGGYARVTLETFSELTAAARLYRRHGFRLLSEDTAPRWGRDAITYQRYELELGSPAARRGGGSRLARPAAFSA